jgi:excinuclease UvrABC nuclease subunit
MPWRDPHNVPLTRIDIVSQIPSESGVYAIMDHEACLLVGEAWNLKARLLELMSVIKELGEFHVIYELCSDEERVARKENLSSALLRTSASMEIHDRELPGISFWHSSISN